MSHDEALEIIKRASRDRQLALQIEQLRERCCVFARDMLGKVDLELARHEKKLPALPQGRTESAVSLRAAAQQRQRLVAQRRELAEAMVMGALFNSDDPGWDPVRGSLRGAGSGGLLMALLKTSGDWKE